MLYGSLSFIMNRFFILKLNVTQVCFNPLSVVHFKYEADLASNTS